MTRKFTRRDFLRTATLSAGVALLARPVSALALVGPAKKRVVILGAGLAGMVAAVELIGNGHDVTLLEARARAGGRVQTLRKPFADGLYAEAGAARIPDDHDLTLKYVRQFDLQLESMYPQSGSAVVLDGRSRREVSMQGYSELMGQTFGPEFQRPASQWSKIKGGSDLLTQAFARKLGDRIRYGSAVVKLEQDAQAVRVTVEQRGARHNISADRVLCTLPFSVLRSIAVAPAFSPPKQAVITTLEYAAVLRVYLQTKQRFWTPKGLNGFAFLPDTTEVWQPTWNQTGTRGILMTYGRLAAGDPRRTMAESSRIEQAQKELGQVFRGLKKNFERGASKNWMDDEWARGAWAWMELKDVARAIMPEGRIHFAGEHLSAWPSWMQGALASGLRAAEEINQAAT